MVAPRGGGCKWPHGGLKMLAVAVGCLNGAGEVSEVGCSGCVLFAVDGEVR